MDDVDLTAEQWRRMVDCKTPKCPQRAVVKLRGPYDGERGANGVPRVAVLWWCDSCETIWRTQFSPSEWARLLQTVQERRDA